MGSGFLSGRLLRLTGHTRSVVKGRPQCIVSHVQICK